MSEKPTKEDTVELYRCKYCESYFLTEQTYYAHGCLFGNPTPENPEIEMSPNED